MELARRDVRVTVDHGHAGWDGRVGLVTRLIEKAVDDPAHTAAFVCGPEIMMRLSWYMPVRCGIPACDIRVSLERNMRVWGSPGAATARPRCCCAAMARL